MFAFEEKKEKRENEKKTENKETKREKHLAVGPPVQGCLKVGGEPLEPDPSMPQRILGEGPPGQGVNRKNHQENVRKPGGKCRKKLKNRRVTLEKAEKT